MANSKKILVKESEEELRKLKIKQPAHLKKRIEMLLILKKSEVSLSKNELSTLLKINHNTAQCWRDLYFKNGIDGLLTYGRIGFKPSIISSELHKALETRLNSPKDAFTSYVDLIQWITENYISNGINYQTINSYIKRHFKAKLKVARKSHIKKDEQAVESFKKTSSKS
jgi:transposase